MLAYIYIKLPMPTVIDVVIMYVEGQMYAELGSTYREAGGVYTYIKKGLGKGMAFLYLWTNYVAAGPASIATLTLVCSGTYTTLCHCQYIYYYLTTNTCTTICHY